MDGFKAIQHIVSLDAIKRSVHGKFNGISVNFDRTQHGIYLIKNLILSNITPVIVPCNLVLC